MREIFSFDFEISCFKIISEDMVVVAKNDLYLLERNGEGIFKNSCKERVPINDVSYRSTLEIR